MKIKPNGFTQYHRTILDSYPRVLCGSKEADYLIYRIPLEKNIILKSILLIEKSFVSILFGYDDNEEKNILHKNGYLD